MTADANIYNYLRAVRDAAGLTRTGKATLWALFSFVDAKTGIAYPSVRRLAGAAGLKSRATRAGIAELLRLGVVTTPNGRHGGIDVNGRGRSTRYAVHLPVLLSMAAPHAHFDGGEGGTSRTQRRHATTDKAAPDAAKVTSEEAIEGGSPAPPSRGESGWQIDRVMSAIGGTP